MSNNIVFHSVGKEFSQNDRVNVAIEQLSFTIREGDYVCILGRSGCGKSTLINLLLGLMQPDRGWITVCGHDPFTDFARLKGKIGCVFQNDRLMPWRSALDNVRLPTEILGGDRSENDDFARSLLRSFGLEGYEQARPSMLSGGMRQRVAIARAMVTRPSILLADESFAHLDAATGDTLRQAFKTHVRQNNQTVIHVTHAIDEALGLADRIITLGKPGRIIRDDIPADTDSVQLKQQILDELVAQA